MKRLYAGLSGIQLPEPKYRFPPEYRDGSRLTYYASFFNSLEINSSFYKTPMRQTVVRWADSVPEDFRFTFKVPREVTHDKELQFDPDVLSRFIDAASAVSARSGCLLVQFPPGLSTEYLDRVENILGNIEMVTDKNQWQVAVEFRSMGWYSPDVYHLLKSYGATLVRHDMPKSRTPDVVLSDVIYLRMHGPTGNYRGSYEEHALGDLAGIIHEWLSEGKTVFVYFNNTAGDAFNNLRSLQTLLH